MKRLTAERVIGYCFLKATTRGSPMIHQSTYASDHQRQAYAEGWRDFERGRPLRPLTRRERKRRDARTRERSMAYVAGYTERAATWGRS